MALKKIGASIVLEGEKEYRQALKDINLEQKELKSEMQLSNAEFKNSQNSLEALQSKYEILSKQIESQKDKVEVYNKALEEAQKKQSQAGETVDKYTVDLAEAQLELENMKKSQDASAESIQEQEKRIAELQGQLDESNASYQKASENVLYWQTGLNNAQSTLVSMNKDLEATEQYLDEASKSADGCAHSIDEFGKRTKQAEENALSFGDVAKANFASEIAIKGLETMAKLVAEVGEGLFNLATDAAFYADNINTLSTQTGVATDTIQALYYSEELLDVSVNTVTASMAKNVKSMNSAAEGSDAVASAYAKLGINVTDSNNQLRDSEVVFWETIDALGKMQNATERDAISMTIFGRSAQQLNPLIKAGSAGFKDLKNEATNLGYVLDQQTLNSLNDTSDALERLSKYGDTVKKEIGAELADEITEAIEKIQSAIEKNEDKIKNVLETTIPKLADGLVAIVDNIDKIIPLLAGLGTGFIAFKTASMTIQLASAAMEIYTTATEGAAVAQEELNLAADANPYVLLASVILAVGAALVTMAMNAKEAKTPMEEMIDSYREQIELEKKAIDERNQRRAETEKDVSNTKALKDELVKLNEKTKLSNEEQQRMKQIVQELNTIMPDLNLQLDEETGHLKNSNDEIEQQIELRQQNLILQAAEEEQVEIAKQIYEAEKLKNEIYEQQQEKIKELAELEKVFYEYQAEALEYGEKAIKVNGETFYSVSELENKYASLEEELNGINSNYNDQLQVVHDLQGEYNGVQETIQGYTQGVQDSTKALEDQKSKLLIWNGELYTFHGANVTRLEELKQAYEDAKKSAEESIRSQIGLFDEMSIKSDLSVKQMKQNLDSQTEVLNTYADDIEKARALVESGVMDEGMLGYLEELGISGAGYLHELVTAAETDSEAFNEVMQSWADQQEAVDKLSEVMADIDTNYSDTLDHMTETYENWQEVFDENNEGTVGLWDSFWKNFEEKTATGSKKVVLDVQNGINDMLQSAKDVLRVTGTRSEEGIELGESYIGSLAEGIRNGQSVVNDAIDDVVREANERIRAAANSINRELGGLL